MSWFEVPTVHAEPMVGNAADLVRVVADPEGRTLGRCLQNPPQDKLLDCLGGAFVQRCGRLVKEENRGVALKGAEQGDDLGFPAGKVTGGPPEKGRGASDAIEPVQEQVLVERAASVDFEGERVAKVRLDASFEERGALVKVDNFPSISRHVTPRYTLAFPLDHAFVERVQ
jgi:hypothetical protein